jgi:hypothetical protein
MRRFCRIASMAAVLAAAPTARAAAASRLAYSRTADAAARCPDERGFRAAVAERLGYDPFFPWAEQTVSVAIFEDKGRLRAKVELVDASGIVRGARELDGRTTDCQELLASLALATSITLDPMAAPTIDGPHPTPEVVGADPQGVERTDVPKKAVETLPDRTAAVHATPRPVAESIAWSLRAGPLLALGAGPAPSAGARLGVGAHRGSFALFAELRADLPTGATSQEGGEARVNVWGGALAPCWGQGPWMACAIAYVGSMQARGSGVERPVSTPVFYAAAGGRIETTLPVSKDVDFILHIDGMKNLTAAELYLHQREVWRTPPFSAALGVAAGVHFP